jgi:Domain of unknown function (DUF5666)
MLTIDATTVYAGTGDPRSLADFKVGDGVGVLAATQSDGTLLATSVTRFDFVGAIEGTAAPNLTVAGRTITTSSTTTFSDLENTALTFGDLSVGNIVGVDGALQADGTIAATSVTRLLRRSRSAGSPGRWLSPFRGTSPSP